MSKRDRARRLKQRQKLHVMVVGIEVEPELVADLHEKGWLRDSELEDRAAIAEALKHARIVVLPKPTDG